MLTGPNVILTLKIAVVAVTVLLGLSGLALVLGYPKLHGRINIVFAILTLIALFSLEVVVRILKPGVFHEHFDATDNWTSLYIHLAFSVPSAVLLLLMLYTGLSKYRKLHLRLAVVFLALWAGTFVTGVFFLY